MSDGCVRSARCVEVAKLAAEPGHRIFVTGATGFIGAYFLRAAVAAGHEVDALTRSENDAASLTAQGATAIVGDLSDANGGLARSGTQRRRCRPSSATTDIRRPPYKGARQAVLLLPPP